MRTLGRGGLLRLLLDLRQPLPLRQVRLQRLLRLLRLLRWLRLLRLLFLSQLFLSSAASAQLPRASKLLCVPPGALGASP